MLHSIILLSVAIRVPHFCGVAHAGLPQASLKLDCVWVLTGLFTPQRGWISHVTETTLVGILNRFEGGAM